MDGVDDVTYVDLDTVDRLLGVPPGAPTWRAAEMAIRGRILATWLSSVVARGQPLAGQATTYLERMRRRVATLHRLGTDLAVAHGVSVLKGPKVAQFLPPPLLRQSGDVDLVATDQAQLWQCVLDLVERQGAVVQGVSVLDSPDGVHLVVTMQWPAEEPYLDKPMGADVATCAYCGDLRTVPVRVVPVPEDDLGGLFAVAEERFQRRYRIKDLLDVLALAQAVECRLGDRLVEVVCALAADLALAPELRQLVRKADGWVPMSPRWHEVIAALSPLAKRERSLRRPDRTGLYRLRFGYPLDHRPSADLEIRIQRRPGGDVATTPVGTCLLVDRPTIDRDVLADAGDYVRSMYASI